MKKIYVRQSKWLGIICPLPSDCDRGKISENLNEAAPLPALPLITSLYIIQA